MRPAEAAGPDRVRPTSSGRRARRLARVLFVVWAVVVWNVVFDRVIVVAGREYVRAATLAARGPGPYARIDDWMRPAVTRGLWMATAAGATILIVGLAAIRYVRLKEDATTDARGSG